MIKHNHHGNSFNYFKCSTHFTFYRLCLHVLSCFCLILAPYVVLLHLLLPPCLVHWKVKYSSITYMVAERAQFKNTLCKKTKHEQIKKSSSSIWQQMRWKHTQPNTQRDIFYTQPALLAYCYLTIWWVDLMGWFSYWIVNIMTPTGSQHSELPRTKAGGRFNFCQLQWESRGCTGVGCCLWAWTVT